MTASVVARIVNVDMFMYVSVTRQLCTLSKDIMTSASRSVSKLLKLAENIVPTSNSLQSELLSDRELSVCLRSL